MGTANKQKYESERGIGKTNEAAGLIMFFSNSADNHACFENESLILSRKYMD
jgi:hypothetical protein